MVLNAAFDGYEKKHVPPPGGSGGDGGGHEVWSGALAGDKYALVVVNLNSAQTKNVTIAWNSALPGGSVVATSSFVVRDLWNKVDLGTHAAGMTLEVEPHDSRMLMLAPVQQEEA